MALDAEAEVASADSRIWYPIRDLFLGPGQSRIDPTRQVLTRFRFRLGGVREASSFKRIMRPQGVALPIVSRLIDKGYGFTIALVNRPRPFEDGCDTQAVEPRVAMVTFMNLDAGNGMAVALIGQPVELAIAAIFAGAVHKLACF